MNGLARSVAAEEEPARGVMENDVVRGAAWIEACLVSFKGIEQQPAKLSRAAGLSRRGGQPEPFAETSAMRLKARGLQLQPGFPEEFQELFLSRDASVGMTAQGLEAIEISALCRVLGSEDVGDHHPPAGRCDAGEFPEHAERVGKIRKRIGARQEIEAVAAMRQARGVSNDEEKRRGPATVSGRGSFEHSRTEVEATNASCERRKRARQRPGPARNVQDALVPPGLNPGDEFADLALRSMCGEACVYRRKAGELSLDVASQTEQHGFRRRW